MNGGTNVLNNEVRRKTQLPGAGDGQLLPVRPGALRLHQQRRTLADHKELSVPERPMGEIVSNGCKTVHGTHTQRLRNYLEQLCFYFKVSIKSLSWKVTKSSLEGLATLESLLACRLVASSKMFLMDLAFEWKYPAS